MILKLTLEVEITPYEKGIYQDVTGNKNCCPESGPTIEGATLNGEEIELTVHQEDIVWRNYDD